MHLVRPVPHPLQSSHFEHWVDTARAPCCFPYSDKVAANLHSHQQAEQKGSSSSSSSSSTTTTVKEENGFQAWQLDSNKTECTGVTTGSKRRCDYRVRSLHPLLPALLQSLLVRSCEQWQCCLHIFIPKNFCLLSGILRSTKRKQAQTLGGNPLAPMAGYTLEFSPVVFSG